MKKKILFIYNTVSGWVNVIFNLLIQPIIFALGTLHVGDEIKEINGISVARQSVENLQSILVKKFILFHFSLRLA